MPYDFQHLPDMPAELMRLIGQIPRGRVATCGALAAALGDAVAARWVGTYLTHHAHAASCRCHRVVRAEGRLGGFAGGDERAKAELLRAEGVAVTADGVDLLRFAFDGFRGPRPLAALSAYQRSLTEQVSLRTRVRRVRWAAGVDVSYRPASGEGFAAYVLVEAATGELLWSTTVRRRVCFPYITSYLSFREAPLLLAVLEEAQAAGRMADVVLVDGSGTLHPRGAGIASHVGVAADVPTIGVTKKLLCGRCELARLRTGEKRKVEAPAAGKSGVPHRPVAGTPGPLPCAEVRIDGRLCGYALLPASGTRRPVFVSPGHAMGVKFAMRLAGDLMGAERLPRPIAWADRLSRAAARGR